MPGRHRRQARPVREAATLWNTPAMQHRIFAYGSNLDPVHLRRWCPGAASLGAAELRGYRLTFPVRSEGDWAGGVASVEPDPHADIRGGAGGVEGV